MDRTSAPSGSVALVSPPWPLFNRPSLQLGALKAYLNRRYANMAVVTYPVYLQIAAAVGYDLYQAVSRKTWRAETVYAALLNPEHLEEAERVFRRTTIGSSRLRKADLGELAHRVKTVSDDFINGTDWHPFTLVGFSLCLCQLTSGLYFLKRIKQRAPHLTAVIGGSALAGGVTADFFKALPQVDAVVQGEGEQPLAALTGHLIRGGTLEDLPPIRGVCTIQSLNRDDPVSFSQVNDLNQLPRPDFSDYFRLLKTLGPAKTFFPTLPLEISRGCWWRKTTQEKKASGCAFCNLNTQWRGYRRKKARKVVEEIDDLTTRHKTLSVAFTDNLIPAKAPKTLFPGIEQLHKDLRLFCEIRAKTPFDGLMKMKTAGVDRVQIGIEALSSALLRKLNKGTTAIDNLEIMKNCEALGIRNISNLILHFPGSDTRDVAETLRNMAFARPFRPMRFVSFWLGYGSPVWRQPDVYGIKAIYNHPRYAALLPAEISRALRFTIQAFRGDLLRQRTLWKPVKSEIKRWQRDYAALQGDPASGCILSYRDGRDFLIIRQKRLGREALTHRLVGASRSIYLFCASQRSLRSILTRFPANPAPKISAFLKSMVEKRLMFEERQRYLSLAVPVDPGKRGAHARRHSHDNPI